jgi:hypothetical protein
MRDLHYARQGRLNEPSKPAPNGGARSGPSSTLSVAWIKDRLVDYSRRDPSLGERALLVCPPGPVETGRRYRSQESTVLT